MRRSTQEVIAAVFAVAADGHKLRGGLEYSPDKRGRPFGRVRVTILRAYHGCKTFSLTEMFFGTPAAAERFLLRWQRTGKAKGLPW